MNRIHHPLSHIQQKEWKIENGAVVPIPIADDVFAETNLELAEVKRKKALEEEQKNKEDIHKPETDIYDAVAVLEGKASVKNKKDKSVKSEDKDILKQQSKDPKDIHKKNKDKSIQSSPDQQSSATSSTTEDGKVQILNPLPFDLSIVRLDYTMTFFG